MRLYIWNFQMHKISKAALQQVKLFLFTIILGEINNNNNNYNNNNKVLQDLL